MRDENDFGLIVDLDIHEVMTEFETPYQAVMIGKTAAFGKGLFLDGITQSMQSDEAVYHTALVQPAMFCHPRPRRVLVAGGGEGATLREVLRHSDVEQVVMVDIDAELVAACRRYLPEWHQGAFDDPRVTLVHEDIRALLADGMRGFALQHPPVGAQPFDVVVLDVGDPIDEGPSQRVFTQEFFELVRGVLAPGGVLVTQAGEFDHSGLENMRSVRATMASVFGDVRLYKTSVPSFYCDWGFALVHGDGLATGAAAPGGMTPPPALAARWQAAQDTAQRLGAPGWRHFDPDGWGALMWLSPSLHQRLALDGGTVLSDDARLSVRTRTADEFEQCQ